LDETRDLIAELDWGASVAPLDALVILESTTDCVLVIGPDWRVRYVNGRAAAEIGRGRDLVGRDLWEAFPEAVGGGFDRAYHETMATGKASHVEEFYVPYDAWFSVDAYRVPQGIAVFFRNVSERKRQEAALVAGEERFRALFETLTQGVMFIDPAGRVVAANKAAEAIVGLPVDKLVGRSTEDASLDAWDAHGTFLPGASRPSMMAFRTGETVRGVVMQIFNARRGERRWISVDAVPQYRVGERVPQAVSVMLSDITEQRRAELALRASQVHLARAQRIAMVGSIERDFRGGTAQWSDGMYRICGVDRASFVPSQEAFEALVHPDDLAIFRAANDTMEGGIDPEPIEYRVVRPDGQLRTLYRVAEIFRDEAGVAIGAIATLKDITELRAVEQEREDFHRQLHHLQRLEALGTLAGGIAHDLNNILVPVRVLPALIKKRLGTESPELGRLQTIEDAAKRAVALVRQILDFSRKEGERKEEALNLDRLVEESLPLLRASIPATVRIQTDIKPVPAVLADDGQLHQVLMNLFTNAAQAIGSDHGTITVSVDTVAASRFKSLAGRPGPSSYVRLVVRDDGPGMDDVTRRRLFEPFFTTKPVGEGTGLGLAVVHGIVTAHGGIIEVASKPGDGAAFTVLLPRLT
jgi:PAS domain S-box-containing protein